MLLFDQLQLLLFPPAKPGPARASRANSPNDSTGGGDAELEARARTLLQAAGAARLAPQVRVRWNPRLRTSAGHAQCRQRLITLNPRLHEHGAAEIDRTLRHELAHLLAHFRAGRRRISAHGKEWQQACRDLGLAGESRCHTLPFPVRRQHLRFFYRCPKCAQDFPRVRRIRRGAACTECCRRYNRGRYAAEFQLRLVQAKPRV